MISKMHKEMNVAINTVTKMTKHKDKAGMQWDVSCIFTYEASYDAKNVTGSVTA